VVASKGQQCHGLKLHVCLMINSDETIRAGAASCLMPWKNSLAARLLVTHGTLRLQLFIHLLFFSLKKRNIRKGLVWRLFLKLFSFPRSLKTDGGDNPPLLIDV